MHAEAWTLNFSALNFAEWLCTKIKKIDGLERKRLACSERKSAKNNGFIAYRRFATGTVALQSLIFVQSPCERLAEIEPDSFSGAICRTEE